MSKYNRAGTLSRRALTRSIVLSGLLGLPLLSACGDASVIELAEASVSVSTNESFGAPVAIGNGTGRSYLVMQADRIVEVGVALSEGAMEGLPSGEGHDVPGHPPFSAPFALEMPAGNPTPFDFVGLDWNPNGHEPPGIYDAAHFDIHFFTISQAERNTIHPTDEEWATKAANFPPASFIPERYVDGGTLGGVEPALASVPLMGLHWIDSATPELNGQAFTETFIYGSWDGEVIFLEPMVTREFLLRKPDFTRELRVAAKGISPARYRIYWDEANREYRVALSEFRRSR